MGTHTNSRVGIKPNIVDLRILCGLAGRHKASPYKKTRVVAGFIPNAVDLRFKMVGWVERSETQQQP